MARRLYCSICGRRLNERTAVHRECPRCRANTQHWWRSRAIHRRQPTDPMDWYQTKSYRGADFSALVGKTLTRAEVVADGQEVVFETADGETYKLYHEQDCCESVYVEDVIGDLSDLVGSPIIAAEESSNREEDTAKYESATWTFYLLRTAKGDVTIRFLGVSNGYYSEAVHFALVP